MALAVTHVIIVIVILDLLRHYVFGKKKFPRYLVVIGGIAGLLPDIDVPLTWIYNFITGTTVTLHGVFTHGLIFPLLVLLLALGFHQQKKMVWAKICYVVAFGLFMHMFLDCLYGGYKTFFWPLSLVSNFCPRWDLYPYASSIDAIILVVWLVHGEIYKRVRDYI